MKFHLRPKTKQKRIWAFIFGQKNENESNLIILMFFFSFSYIQSPSQPYNAPPIPRSVSPFLQVVLVDGILLSSCTTVYTYFCGIFLDDISTRKQFSFLIYFYRVKAVFHCALLAAVSPDKN